MEGSEPRDVSMSAADGSTGPVVGAEMLSIDVNPRFDSWLFEPLAMSRGEKRSASLPVVRRTSFSSNEYELKVDTGNDVIASTVP